jgi:type IV protein arginine methyltransferase
MTSNATTQASVAPAATATAEATTLWTSHAKIQQMLEACSSGNSATVAQFIQEHAHYVSQQDDRTGISPLMVACQVGNLELVQFLLNEGAPWNAIDRTGKCAGDYATDAEHWTVVNYLVEWATRSELILGTTQRVAMKRNNDSNHNAVQGQEQQVESMAESQAVSPPQQEGVEPQQQHKEEELPSSTKPDYLKHRLRYNNDGTALLDDDDDAVMMEWERPIMKAHASVLMEAAAPGTRRVMNVGFGMGIIDSALQEYHPALHIIIEAHPNVYQRMLADKWNEKPNVQIYHGKWQDVIPQLLLQKVELDAIFYDTYAEHALDMEDFHGYLPHLLSKRQGVYSFFNGLAPDNLFFHGVGTFLLLEEKNE